MIHRAEFSRQVRATLAQNPVCALLGPRQCGKTTLALELCKGQGGDYFDLEDPLDLARLEAPMVTLKKAKGLVVIDEIQTRPELFSFLRVLADRNESTRFLVLGSASPRLVKEASQSLAGRIGFVDLTGFNLTEVDDIDRLWLRGGFPRSYLAESEEASVNWRRAFIRTFLERDIPALGITVPAETLRRFWTMTAHYHGRVWNAAEFARSLGRTEPTARRYLDILSGSYMVRQLQPWFENLKKRQVKSPKVYIRDSGILHSLLGLESYSDVSSHPKLGASWEGFVIEQLISAAKTRDVYFWATHSGAELDLLVLKKGKRFGFEVKYTDSPKITKSMRIAKEDLSLDFLTIVYPGDKAFEMDHGISAMPVGNIPGLPWD